MMKGLAEYLSRSSTRLSTFQVGGNRSTVPRENPRLLAELWLTLLRYCNSNPQSQRWKALASFIFLSIKSPSSLLTSAFDHFEHRVDEATSLCLLRLSITSSIASTRLPVFAYLRLSITSSIASTRLPWNTLVTYTVHSY